MKSLDEVIESMEYCTKCGCCEKCTYQNYDGVEDCSEKVMLDALVYLNELQDIRDNMNLTRFISEAKDKYGVEIKTTKKVKLEDLCKLANLIFMGEQ